jgi:hypothetical protein
MSEPTTETTPDAQSSLHPIVKYGLSALAALVVGIPTTLFLAKPAPAPTAAAAAKAPTLPRQIQIVSLFDCQYITINEPFFLLHLPTCTNTHHYKQ